jgi:hypothetical protein
MPHACYVVVDLGTAVSALLFPDIDYLGHVSPKLSLILALKSIHFRHSRAFSLSNSTDSNYDIKPKHFLVQRLEYV